MSVVIFFALLLAFPSSLIAADAKPPWQVEWERTVAAAEEEGRVMIYSYPGATLLPIDAGVFQKKFPKIKVVTVSGDAVQRILSERRAGKYLADVYYGGIHHGCEFSFSRGFRSNEGCNDSA